MTSPPTALRRAFARRRSLARLGGVMWAFGLVAVSLLMFRVTAGSSPCPMADAVAASSVRGTTLSEMSEDDSGCAADCGLPHECTCPCHGTCVCTAGHCAAVLAASSPPVAVLSATRRSRSVVHVDHAPQSHGREPALRPPIA